MSWIESHQSLLSHRKTMAVAELLDVPRYLVIGHLHALWWWGLDNADINGVLTGIREKSIASAAGWPDKGAVKFTAALVEAGFLDQSDGRYVLHNWYKYAGKLNVRRESERRRAAERRTSEQNTADVLRTPDVPLLGTVPTVPTVPNQPDPTDLSSPPAPKRAPKAKVPVPLTDEEIGDLHSEFGTFPAVDATIAQAMAHEAALKYPNGCYRYVQGWLRKDMQRTPSQNGRSPVGATLSRNPRQEAIDAGFIFDD